MQLRPYQAAAIYSARSALAAMPQGQRRSVLLCAPTGSGKTVVGAQMARMAVDKNRRVAWVVHRVELVDQAAAALERLGLVVGVMSASSSRRVRPNAPVQIASLDTLRARGQRPPADLLLIDECHRGVCTSYRELLALYPHATVCGLTATPQRADSVGLGGELFRELIVVATPAELLEQGYLVDFEIVRPASQLDSRHLAQRPVDAYKQYAEGRQALVFASSVEHATLVAKEFGDCARLLTGTTPANERATMLRDYTRGKIKVIVNVGVLTEGVDLPNTSCIVIARSIGSAGLFMQTVGRGSRPHPGKDRCILLDLLGVSHTWGHPYCEREYTLDGTGMARKGEVASHRFCATCGAVRLDDGACAECGAEGRDTTVTVTGEALYRVPAEIRYAHVRKQDDEARAANLRKWKDIGKEKGYNPGFAYAKYRAVYGENPPTSVKALSGGPYLNKDEDVIGKKYGRLTVTGNADRRPTDSRRILWQCQCGKTGESRLHSLKTGNTKSCGCQKRESATASGVANRKDYTGLVCGDYEAIRPIGAQGGSHDVHWTWRSKCCGHEKNMRAGDARRGYGVTCPCKKVKAA